jgi:nucleotide-binding universal stress UspA family protein
MRKRKPGRREFPIVIATDGSAGARAATATASGFPWPVRTTAHAVIARRTRWAAGRPRYVLEAFDRHLEQVAAGARRLLARRWAGADVAIRDASPVDAILGEARRRGARVVVVGSRGHGLVGRLVLGSVSRSVVRRAACPVLVVRRRRETRSVVVGFDGSAHARRAVRFLASLRPTGGARALVVQVVEPTVVRTSALLPRQIRSWIAREATTLNAEQIRAAKRQVQAIAPRLERAGWRVRTLVVSDTPGRGLLRAVRAAGADLLVIGARGVGGIERLLLGSVAEEALSRLPVNVLLVRGA